MFDVVAIQLSVLLLALAIDTFIGEPPAAVHPVVWMGRVISEFEKVIYRGSVRRQKRRGALAALFTVGMFTLPVALFQIAGFTLLRGNVIALVAFIVISAYLLKCSFTIAMLQHEAVCVADLAYQDIERARFRLRSLVSRDRGTLTREQILSGVCESVAENTIDSIVSPVFFFAAFGVAGAILYRTVNTLDSMLGYVDHRKAAGAFSAHLDDVLNYVPTRIAVPLMLVSFQLLQGTEARVHAVKVMKRDAARKGAINSGIPIALFAGGLGVTFVKPQSYVIGDTRREITGTTVSRALQVMQATSVLAVLIAILVIVVVYGWF